GSRNRTHDQRFTKAFEDLVTSLHHQLLTASAHLHRSSRMQCNARASKPALLRFRLQLRLFQISTWVPNSITRLGGIRKYSTTLPAFRIIAANNLSRHIAMPAPALGITVSRLKKKEVSSMLNSRSWTLQASSACGTSGVSLKPKKAFIR